MGDEFAVILWWKVDVIYEPFLCPFEKLAFLSTRLANFNFSAVVTARTWVGLRLMTSESDWLRVNSVAEGTFEELLVIRVDLFALFGFWHSLLFLNWLFLCLLGLGSCCWARAIFGQPWSRHYSSRSVHQHVALTWHRLGTNQQVINIEGFALIRVFGEFIGILFGQAWFRSDFHPLVLLVLLSSGRPAILLGNHSKFLLGC